MDYFLTPQGALLLAIGGPLLGWFGKGSAAMLWRWWTGAPRQERAVYFNSLADLGAKLKATGMSVEEVRELGAMLNNPTLAGSAGPTIVEAAVNAAAPREPAAEPNEVAAFGTNFAMKLRAQASYEAANAKLDQSLVDLSLLIGGEEAAALTEASVHWSAYRKALEKCTMLRYKGGSHAPLAATLRGFAETERRTAEIDAEVAERAQL